MGNGQPRRVEEIFSNPQSAISNQQSAISNQQSAISNQQSATSNQQPAISNVVLYYLFLCKDAKMPNKLKTVDIKNVMLTAFIKSG